MAKRLTIGLAALAGVLGAGGASFAAFSGEAKAGTEAPEREHHFVPLEAIEAPIIGLNRVEGALRVTLVLDAADAASAELIKARLPEIRAASVAASIEFSRLYASSFAAVDARKLSASMTAALKRAEPKIEQVLIVEVAARPA